MLHPITTLIMKNLMQVWVNIIAVSGRCLIIMILTRKSCQILLMMLKNLKIYIIRILTISIINRVAKVQ